MNEKSNPGFDTLCIHAGHRQEGARAHLTPIYASSTYTFDGVQQAADIFQGKEEGYIYGRFGNPTIREAEEKIAAMEAHRVSDATGAPLELYALLHSSGMAAVTTMLLSNLKSGDKIITHKSLYGGTQEMIDKILPDLQIETVLADFGSADAVATAIKNDDRIRLMYIETPANPTLQCVDIAALSAVGKAHGLVVCADNTFATPYLQQPFRYDVDFVMHSTTKFLNGHGTAVGGILIGRDKEKMQGSVRKMHRLLGGNSNAMEAFLLVNGLRTLGLRMERHCDNAIKVAGFLEKNPAVAAVNHTGLASHPDYAIAAKQMRRPSPVLSFELRGGLDAGISFMDKLQLCTNAVSLGTCDTILTHPASTTHVGVPREVRIASGITDGLIRMSVGLENAEDILADLEQALG